MIAESFEPIDSAIYQDMRWCTNCGGPKVCLSVFEFEGGRVVVCLGCGEEKLAPFTRVTGEAA